MIKSNASETFHLYELSVGGNKTHRVVQASVSWYVLTLSIFLENIADFKQANLLVLSKILGGVQSSGTSILFFA